MADDVDKIGTLEIEASGDEALAGKVVINLRELSDSDYQEVVRIVGLLETLEPRGNFPPYINITLNGQTIYNSVGCTFGGPSVDTISELLSTLRALAKPIPPRLSNDDKSLEFHP